MILVTGATGELGSVVVRALRGMGQSVRAFVRAGSNYFLLNDTGCTYFFGDLRDRASLRRACQGVDHLICCSGVRVENRRDNHQSVTVDGHGNLWEAAVMAGVQRAVFVSALGVDRSYAIPWFDGKRQAERSLAESGLDHVILRPTPFSSNYARWARMAGRRRVLVLPGSGQASVAPIASRDLGLYAIGALDPGAPSGSVFKLSGPGVYTTREVVEQAMTAHPPRGRVLYAGTSGGALAGRIAQLAGQRWRHHIMVMQRWLSDDFCVDMAALPKHLTIVPLTLEASLALDHERLDEAEDPERRAASVVYRRFTATVYTPGAVDLDKLPKGPRRYDP
jgi:NADH dehydrogenase